jgi:hypothetical protein
MAGFRPDRSLAGGAKDQMSVDVELGASQTINEGDCLVLDSAANGNKLRVATSADAQVDFVAAETMATSSTGFQTANALVLPTTPGGTTTTVIPKPKCYKAHDNALLFKIPIIPLIGTVQAGATTTVVTAANASFASASANDYRGGMIYVNSQGGAYEQSITASGAASGNNIAFTVLSPFPAAPSAGDLATVVPFGFGGSPKLLTKNTLDCTVANKSGGPVEVLKIALKSQYVLVRFL